MSNAPAQASPLHVGDAPALPLRRPRSLWLAAAGLVLTAYAIMGKGAAYIGVPPIFIGEILLAAGIAWFVLWGHWRYARMPALLWLVLPLCIWGGLRTLPYVSEYGFDAFRDAVIWGYSAFAFIFFYAIMMEPGRLDLLIRRYAWCASLCVIGMPAVWAARFVLGDATPRWPWSQTMVIDPKAGDVMVHLSGILAFWASGLAGRVGWVRMLLLAALAAVIGAYERAGMFAFLLVFILCFAFRPGQDVLKRLVVIGLMAVASLALSGLELEVPVAESSKAREISFKQFVANLYSAFGSSDMGDLDDTKQWRLNWWGEIVGYTFRGEYFWTGKGFGVNLADDDGFQVMADHSLRSPHNAHLVILARSGVPGLLMWTVLQGAWAWAIFVELIASVRSARPRWSGLLLFLLSYWVAFMVNATFDVFLEGPMGGIWFWSIYGTGVAAVCLHRRRPELLDADPHRA